MRIFGFILVLFTSFCSSSLFSQQQNSDWELPDFICSDYNLRFISCEDMDDYHYRLQLKKIVSGELKIQSSVEAFAEKSIELNDDEYLLLGQRSGKMFIFTLYEPKINKQWTYGVKASEEGQALYKYRQKIKGVIDIAENEPKNRTGKDLSNSVIKSLLKEKVRADRKLYVYYSKGDFDNDSSVYLGEFIGHTSKSIRYRENDEVRTMDYKDFHRLRIDGKGFISVTLSKYYTVLVTPIGFKEKYFYLNAGTTLFRISGSRELHYLQTVSNRSNVHFVSDSESSEIYQLHDLKKDKSSSLKEIFECVESTNTQDLQVLIDEEIKCVQRFILN